MHERDNLKIGLALGSGSARGWAHIGVIRELEAAGIYPDIICGSSIGAFVGAAYANNKLDELEKWVLTLSWKEIINYLDISLLGGGFIQGEKLFRVASEKVDDPLIESLPRLFGAVATELDSGREIWFREGSLKNAVRASIGLPGLFAPVQINGQWLVDGGLSNPVPVSLCRAMGADIVIAVNLNGEIVGRQDRQRLGKMLSRSLKTGSKSEFFERISAQLRNTLQERKEFLLSQLFGRSRETPGLFDVMTKSIYIMQDRITRSRMAGDPPEIILAPRLSEMGLLEFDQAAIAIGEGRECVQRARFELEQIARTGTG